MSSGMQPSAPKEPCPVNLHVSIKSSLCNAMPQNTQQAWVQANSSHCIVMSSASALPTCRSRVWRPWCSKLGCEQTQACQEGRYNNSSCRTSNVGLSMRRPSAYCLNKRGSLDEHERQHASLIVHITGDQCQATLIHDNSEPTTQPEDRLAF